MKYIRDFPLFKNNKNLCFLDNASMSQKPQVVLDALMDYYTHYNANVGRGLYAIAEQATSAYERAREIIAQFIGAQSHEIVFTKNATEGINFIAQVWAREHLKAGDEILLTQLEHHANLLPWQRVAAQTGAVLKFIPIDADGRLIMGEIDKLITKKTKLVATTHSSNAIGTNVDVAAISKKALAVGAKVLVDACQTAPHMKLDVKKLGADFLVFSGYKILAPTGVGVLYINGKLHGQVTPYNLGGGIVNQAAWDEVSFLEAPKRYEAGTPPIAQVIGLAAGIEYLQQAISWSELKNLEADLCSRLIDGLQQFDRVKILGPIDQLKIEGHLVTFVIDGIHPHDVAAYLAQKNICVRAGHFCCQPLLEKLGYKGAVRASFYLYSSQDDVDRLIDGVSELIKKF